MVSWIQGLLATIVFTLTLFLLLKLIFRLIQPANDTTRCEVIADAFGKWLVIRHYTHAFTTL